MFESPPFWMYIVGFLLVLGPLITVHEFGHYLVGRWFGVKAEAFSVGFGKEIFGRTDRRGTRWKLSAVPLGGYVQFKGDMNPASMPDADMGDAAPPEERDGSFHHAKLWKRTLIVFAGPATNLLVAIGILAAFNLAYGKPLPADPAEQNYIVDFTEISPAREAGIRVGDRISAIDGETKQDYRAVQRAILPHPGKNIEVTVERGDEVLTIPVTVRGVEMEDRFGNMSTIGLIGIESRPTETRFEPVGLGAAIAMASGQTVDIVEMMVRGIGQIFAGHRSLEELGGPIKIAKWSGEQLSLGPDAFVWFVAMVSINLAFINLLPIPALDGGHLAFYAAEAVRRKPIGPRGQEWAYRTGIALVLMLMLFVTVNDVVSLPVFGG